MSTSDGPEDLVTHFGSAPSMLNSFASNPENLNLRGTSFSLDRYITNYDPLEAFSCGISPTDSLYASLEASRSRMRASRNYSGTEFDQELQSSSGLSYVMETREDTATWVNKDDQRISSENSTPVGRNATWDMNDGEERTQPRRGSRARDGRQRTQASVPRPSSSANGNRNRTQSQISIPMIASQRDLQTPWSSRYEPIIEQVDERNELAPHPLGFLASSSETLSGDHPPSDPLSSYSTADLQGNGVHRDFDRNPCPLSISATPSTERSEPSEVSIRYEPQTQVVPRQQLGTGLPDIVCNRLEETTFYGFLPAPNFMSIARNANHFRPGDSRMDSTGYFASSPNRSPPSHVPSLSHGSSVSRGADFSPRLVNENTFAPHVEEPLGSRKETERDDDGLEWFRRYINDDMLEAGDE